MWWNFGTVSGEYCEVTIHHTKELSILQAYYNRHPPPPPPDTRIIRGHRLPISRYRDKLFAIYCGQIAVLKIVDFFTTPAFLSPSESRKSQATKFKYTAFKTNSALNKHCISRNQWMLIHYHLAPSGLETMWSIIAKLTRVKISL